MPLEIRMPGLEIEHLFATPGEELSVALAAQEGSTEVLETPVMRAIDLTGSHGVDITLERLEEMAAAYDPQIEAASLNLDHGWGGPSLGWCEKLWVLDGDLWVRYVDLAAETVEGIRSKRYLRRSAEFVTKHATTGGWYFTGLALLGNARPAIHGLPPLQLFRRTFLITGAAAPPKEEKTMADQPPPPAAPAVPAEETRVALSAGELAELREGVAVAASLRRENAELQADKAIAQLGSRVTPAMKRDLRPVLVQLLSSAKPQTVKLSVAEGGKDVEKEFGLADAFLRILGNSAPFNALSAGELASEDAPPSQDGRPAEVAALHLSAGIDPARHAALQAKYGIRTNEEN